MTNHPAVLQCSVQETQQRARTDEGGTPEAISCVAALLTVALARVVESAGAGWQFQFLMLSCTHVGNFCSCRLALDASTFHIPAGIILIQQVLWQMLGLGSAATTAVTAADMSRVVATATKGRVSASSEATAFRFASVSSGLPDSCSAMVLQIRIREDASDQHAHSSEAERSRLLRSFQLAADAPDVASTSCALAATGQLTFQPGVRRVVRPPHLRPPIAPIAVVSVGNCGSHAPMVGAVLGSPASTMQMAMFHMDRPVRSACKSLSFHDSVFRLVLQGLLRWIGAASSKALQVGVFAAVQRQHRWASCDIQVRRQVTFPVDANRHIQQSGLKACRSLSFGDAAFGLALRRLLSWIGALHQSSGGGSRALQVKMLASVQHQPHPPASLLILQRKVGELLLPSAPTSDISVNANLVSWPLYRLFHSKLRSQQRVFSSSLSQPARAGNVSCRLWKALRMPRLRGHLHDSPLSALTLTVLPCIRLQSAFIPCRCFPSLRTSCVTEQSVSPAIARRASVCALVRNWRLCRQLNRTAVRVNPACRLDDAMFYLRHLIVPVVHALAFHNAGCGTSLSVVVREAVHPLPKVKLNLARFPDYLVHVRALRRQMNLSFMSQSLISKRLKSRVCTQIMLSSLFRHLRDEAMFII